MRARWRNCRAADRKAQRPGLIMAAIYRTLLNEIARDGYRVLDRRTSLTPVRKLWIAWKTSRQGMIATRTTATMSAETPRAMRNAGLLLRLGLSRRKQGATHERPVAIIGGGWAGCAAAVTLAAAEVPVVLYEAATVLGGRARRVERDGLPLDNGQHLLLGAYERTLELLARVHGERAARAQLVRRPLAIVPFGATRSDALTLLVAPRAGTTRPSGRSACRRAACPGASASPTLRWFRTVERAGFVRPAHETVAQNAVAAAVARCAVAVGAAMPRGAQHAGRDRVRAGVRQRAARVPLAGAGDASDFLLPATDLSTLFPDAGRAVRRGARRQRADRRPRADRQGKPQRASLLRSAATRKWPGR